MTLPPVIKLHVYCTGTGDLSGIIFGMEVRAGTKNPYHVYFPKTDATGNAQISSDDFRGQFRDSDEMFLMDYNGTVEDASDLVTLKLFNRARMAEHRDTLLHFPLGKHESKRWRSRLEIIDYYLTARNDDFDFAPQLIRIPENGHFHVRLSSKVASSPRK